MRSNIEQIIFKEVESALYSWLIVILVVFFLITIDFLYLCDHINDTIIENGYFKNILTIIISILSSWFISKYLGSFFLNFTSEVWSYQFIRLYINNCCINRLSLLFNAARHDIVTRKKTVQQASKKNTSDTIKS